MSDLTNQITNVKMLLAFLENQLPKEHVADKQTNEDKPKKKAVDEDKPKKKAKKVEHTPAEEEEKPKKVETKKEKNLTRFTPAMKAELTKVLKAHDIELTEELRKEFIDHLNSLETEEYTKVNLASHMETFAKSKGKHDEKKEEPAKVGGSPFAGQEDPPDLNKMSNAHSYNLSKLIKYMSSEKLEDMKKTEILKPVGNGNYWDAKSGMWIFENGDEETTDPFEFEGKTYVVNEVNKRVYQTTDDKDLFVGFLGIGQFKKMKV
jgi:hypothetical protein